MAQWLRKYCGTIVVAAVFLAFFFGSLLLPLRGEICGPNEYTNAKECADYHMGPFVLVGIAYVVDRHNGIVTALATAIMAAFTFVLMSIGRDADRNYRVTERAYVKLSHIPPGVSWDPDDDGRFFVNIQSKNFGTTPAQVAGFTMTARVVPTANRAITLGAPTYQNAAVQRGAFLVAVDAYSHVVFLRVTPAEKAGVMARTHSLAVFGFVDYSDVFGTRHRGGYGRWYDPQRDVQEDWVSDEDFAQRTNLIYIEDTRYNYDRLRARGEGKDWEDL